jgi:type IV secretory pathway TraG/TraD family ATPase VirD4
MQLARRSDRSIVRTSVPFKPVLVVGASGVGKSMRALRARLRSWQGPVMYVGPKADLVDETYADRARMGPTYLFDPALCTGGRYRTDGFDLLRSCRDLDGAGVVMEAIRGTGTGDGNTDWWTVLGSALNQVVAYAYAVHGYTVADWHRAILTGEEFEVRSLLSAARNETAEAMFESHCAREEKNHSSVLLTARQQLRFLDSPSVQAALSRNDFDPADLIRPGAEPTTLFVTMPVHRMRLYGCLLALLVNRAVESALEREATYGPAEPPLLLVIDEVTALALSHVPLWVSTCRSAGVQLLLATQSASNLVAAYGEAGAGQVLASSDLLLLGGGRDPRTARLLAEWMAGGDIANAPADLPRDPYALLRALPARGDGSALLLTDTRDPELVRLPAPWDAFPDLSERRPPEPPHVA